MAIENGKLVPKTIDPPAVLGPAPTAVPVPGSSGFAAFAGGERGYVGVASNDKHVSHGVSVIKLDTGSAIGTVNLPGERRECGFSLSPDGRHLAIARANASLEGEAVDLCTVADGRTAASFRPHFDPKARTSDFVAARFLTADKFVTFTSTGGFAVWSPADQTKLLSVPGALKPQTIPSQWFKDRACGLDATPDGQTVAVFDGRGYALYRTTDGTRVGRTDPVPADGPYVAGPACFRSDGTRLAALFYLGAGKPTGILAVVWDARTGKQLAQFRPVVTSDPQETGVQWFGPDHVIVRAGGGWKNQVWAVDIPQQVSEVVTHVFPGGPADKLWAVVQKSSVGWDGPQARTFSSRPARRPSERTRSCGSRTEGSR
ncbi:hypothetical protein [Gemmata sp.]|uniref:hypothetical protein n=1 Tax=Gemmata sp. TaxID=1914242 RepID=UPI003F6FD2F3